MVANPKPQPREEYVTTRLESDDAKSMRQLARENERSLSAEVRLAVRRYLEERAA